MTTPHEILPPVPSERQQIKVGESCYNAAEVANAAYKKLTELKYYYEKAISFYERHQSILDGLKWEACPFSERIEIECDKYYMGSRTPASVAKQFGGKWIVKQSQYSTDRDFYRDWLCEIDGLKVLLKKAVCLKPIASSEEGEAVAL